MKDVIWNAFADEMEKVARHPFLAAPSGEAVRRAMINAGFFGGAGVAGLSALGDRHLEGAYLPAVRDSQQAARERLSEYQDNPSAGSMETLLSADDSAKSALSRRQMARGWNIKRGFPFSPPGRSASNPIPQPDPETFGWDPGEPI